MSTHVAIIGFGEAAQAFAGDRAWRASVRAYDKLTDQFATRAAKLDDYAKLGVEGANSLAEAVDGARLILSLVTADQALEVAMAAMQVRPTTVFLDMNSVAPSTKEAAASAIEGRGGLYVDVAIMSPVSPNGLRAPLLLSGPAAADAQALLRSVGFSNIRVIGSRVGQASAVKMIRSVIVKGIEALTAEAILAAANAGVVDEVLGSLDASERSPPWAERANYNLDRMMVHGIRRADEMEEAVRMLETLGVEPALTRGTVQRQREIGSLAVHPGSGLVGKLAQLQPAKANAA